MRQTGLHFWISAILSFAVCLICIHIEILNHLDGGYLPVDFSDYPAGANTKWRYAFTEREVLLDREFWRYREELELGDNYVIPEEAIKNIEDKVEIEISVAQTHNRLHSAVASFGLLQYLLCPVSILFAGLYSSKPAGAMRIRFLIRAGYFNAATIETWPPIE